MSHSAIATRKLVRLLCFCVFFSVLNGNMFNVAVPDIAQDFRLGPAQVSWVLSGYILLFALASFTYGKLADRYPLRPLLTLGLVLFAAGALGGLLAPSYAWLLTARLVQAAGGGAIPALGMLIATRLVAVSQRGRVFGAITATVSLAMGLGPLMGGLLAGAGSWHWLFLPALSTLLALPGFWRLLPAEEAGSPGAAMDVSGWLLLVTTLAAALLGTGLGYAAMVVLALVGGCWLWRHCRAREQGVIKASLLRLPVLQGAFGLIVLGVSTVFAQFFLVPWVLRQVYSCTTVEIGLIIFPAAACGSVAARYAGSWSDLWGSRRVLQLALLVLAASHLWLVLLVGQPWPWLWPGLIALYLGFAGLHSNLARAVSVGLPAADSGAGMGLYNLAFFAAGSLGTAVAGQLMALLQQGGAPPLAAVQGTWSLALATVLAALGVLRWWRRQGVV